MIFYIFKNANFFQKNMPFRKKLLKLILKYHKTDHSFLIDNRGIICVCDF